MSDDAVNAPAGDADDRADSAPDGASGGAGDDALAAAALAAAAAAVEQLSSEAGSANAGSPPSADGEAAPLSLPNFGTGDPVAGAEGLELLDDVNLDIRVELGRTVMLVEDVLKLGEGAVVELDKLAGDPVDIYANGRHIAKGEVLVLNDNFCIRVNEIVAAHAEVDDQEASAA